MRIWHDRDEKKFRRDACAKPEQQQQCIVAAAATLIAPSLSILYVRIVLEKQLQAADRRTLQ
jgi:hypothetical protein